MNTLLNNLNQLVVIVIVTIAIIAAVVYVLTHKNHSNSVVTTSIPQIRVAAVEDDKAGLMNKYAIACENNRFVWGSHSFDTLEEAVRAAEEFVDRISVDFRLPIQAF